MKRRDFFKSLAAASAALYGGAKVVEAAVPPPAPLLPSPAKKKKKPLPWHDLKDDPQRVIKEILKGCAAVSMSRSDTIGGYAEVTVEYRYSEDREYPVNLNDMLPKFLSENAAVKDITVEISHRDELFDLNHPQRQPYLAMPTEQRIIVTWVTA